MLYGHWDDWKVQSSLTHVVGSWCWLPAANSTRAFGRGSVFLHLGLSTWLLELPDNMVARFQEVKAEAAALLRPSFESYTVSLLLQPQVQTCPRACPVARKEKTDLSFDGVQQGHIIKEHMGKHTHTHRKTASQIQCQ